MGIEWFDFNKLFLIIPAYVLKTPHLQKMLEINFQSHFWDINIDKSDL